MDSLDILKFIF